MIYILIPALLTMILFMICRRKEYNILLLNTVVIFVALSVIGILSTYLMYFIENSKWGGTSLFGAVLFPPLIAIAITKTLKLPTRDITDFIAPSAMIMITAMKANCILVGCCGGRALWYDQSGIAVRFPSQLVETIVTLLIAVLLLYLDYRKKAIGKLYPIGLIIYGVLRFILNFFRAPTEEPFFGLTIGNVWSLVATIIGILWIFIMAYIDVDKKLKTTQKQSKSEE